MNNKIDTTMRGLMFISAFYLVIILSIVTLVNVKKPWGISKDEFNEMNVRVYIVDKFPLVFMGKMAEEEKEINKKMFTK